MTRTSPTSLHAGPAFARHLAGRTPYPFRHDLHEQPKLTLDAIAALAAALPDDSLTAETAVKPLVSSADYRPEFSTARDAADRIRNIDASDTWLTLLNIEQVPAYRALVDEQLASLALSAGIPFAGWTRRMGFIFVSSPNSVTAAHFDIEQSLCLQLRGSRTLYFGEFGSDELRQREVRRYWDGSFGRMDSMPAEGSQVHLEPGQAAYIPPWTPHWITNTDAASLSLTLTFFNRDNATESMVQAFNHKLARLHVGAAPYGAHPRRDAVKAGIMRANAAVKNRIRPAKPEARG